MVLLCYYFFLNLKVNDDFNLLVCSIYMYYYLIEFFVYFLKYLLILYFIVIFFIINK